MLRACQSATQWRTCENIAEKSQITLHKQSHCEFAILVSSMLNKSPNCAHKTRADWLNHFYRPWESKGFKKESQNDQLHLT